MKSLITGINGFAGLHLLRKLKERGENVWGIYHPDTDPGCVRDEFPRLRLEALDIMARDDLKKFFRVAKPDRVYHLAAQSHVPTSWENPEETFRVNVIGAIHMVKAASGLKKPPRMLFVSSGDVYGDGTAVRGTLNEDSPIRPLNPYAASKAAMELAVCAIAGPLKTPVVCVRPFNHIGPGQAAGFVASDFARQIALIEAGKARPPIRVGNLNARKDFTDVRDMVRAYVLALDKCPPGGVYNLGSGKSYLIRDILEILIGLSKVRPKVVTDRTLLRAATSGVAKTGSARFRKITGWKPEYNIKDTLGDILDYWRDRVKGAK